MSDFSLPSQGREACFEMKEIEHSLLSGLCLYNLNVLYCSKSEVQSSSALV